MGMGGAWALAWAWARCVGHERSGLGHIPPVSEMSSSTFFFSWSNLLPARLTWQSNSSPSTTQTSSNPPMSSPLPLVASLLPDDRWLFDVDVSEERKGRRIDWKTRLPPLMSPIEGVPGVCAAESLNSTPVVGNTLAPMKPLVAPQVASTGVDEGTARRGDDTMKPSPDFVGAAANPGPERLVCSAPKPKSTPVAESTGSLMLFRWEPRDARRSYGNLEVVAAAA
mmetsp:Transcript_8219/g.21148  ORF Transcript_8219/g.21148 Transcript_8219/m.21148 type:complete len:225 (+) Transcript_8219:2158-2832(+)